MRLTALCCAAAMLGCGSGDAQQTAADAGSDTTLDLATDAGADATSDATVEAESEAAPDAAADAGSPPALPGLECAGALMANTADAERRFKAYHLTLVPTQADRYQVTLTLDATYDRSGSTPVATVDVAEGLRADSVNVVDAALTLAAARSDTVDDPVLVGTLTIGADTRNVACWPRALVSTYRYDADGGLCRSGSGTAGMNRYPLPMVRQRKDGECVAFARGMLNEADYTGPRLRGWVLAGADLELASLSFADLLDADLRGAKLQDMQYGYAHITGAIDGHTASPAHGCTVDGGAIDCLR